MNKTDEKKFNENINLIHYVLHKMNFDFRLYDDLFQEGAIGLCEAIKKYNPSKAKFSTFAVNCIKNSIMRALSREEAAKAKKNEYILINIEEARELV